MSEIQQFSGESQTHRFDVCVVGGGMSGLCAAIASARNGARTALVHDRPVLGGNASSEVRMHICGTRGSHLKETGILEEIQLANLARNPTGDYNVWDSVLYEHARYQEGLSLFLNCSCLGTETEGDPDERVIRAIHCWELTSQIRRTFEATVFIDCSGDSILANDSGALFRRGREGREEFDEDIAPSKADLKTMGNTILLQIDKGGEKPVRFTPPSWAYRFEGPEDLKTRMTGVNGHNFWWIELGGINDTLLDSEAISNELYKTAWGVWDYLKNVGENREKTENWELTWIGSLPGKRENRRYVGDFILTQHDLQQERTFEDTVGYGGWTLDDHHPAGILYPGLPTIHHRQRCPYPIPYRALYSKNVGNLLFAGRNISATHVALSSTRVMATCAVLGQAAGTAASICIRKKTTPRGVYQNHLLLLQKILHEDDQSIPGFIREINPLSLDANRHGNDVLTNGIERSNDLEENLWIGPAMDPIEYTWSSPREIAGFRMVLDSDLNSVKRMPYSYPVSRSAFQPPGKLLKSFEVQTRDGDGKWVTAFETKNNRRRLIRLPIGRHTDGLRVIPRENWGGTRDMRIFSIEALDRCEEKNPISIHRVTWKEIVSRIPREDLLPPDSGAEEKVSLEDRRRMASGA